MRLVYTKKQIVEGLNLDQFTPEKVLVREIARIMKPGEEQAPWYKVDMQRKPHIYVSKAHYDEPNLFVLELEGSPPRMTTVVWDLHYSFPYVMFAGKRLENRGKRSEAIVNAVRTYLEDIK